MRIILLRIGLLYTNQMVLVQFACLVLLRGIFIYREDISRSVIWNISVFHPAGPFSPTPSSLSITHCSQSRRRRVKPSLEMKKLLPQRYFYSGLFRGAAVVLNVETTRTFSSSKIHFMNVHLNILIDY